MRKRDKEHALAFLQQLCLDNLEVETRLDRLKERVAKQNDYLNSLRKLITEQK